MNKIEQYLIDLKYSYQEVKPNFWLIDDAEHSLEGMIIMYTEPLIIFRLQVMNVPKKSQQELFSKLLELNASDMIRGSYGIEGDKVVITDTLQYESFTFADFQASLDAIGLALTQHYPILSVYREK